MKQLVQNYKSGDLQVAEVPAPALRPGGVLVAVAASLVSAGTERTMVNLAQASMLDKARQRPDLVRQVLAKAQQEGVLTTYQKVMNRLDSLAPLGYSCAGHVLAVGAGVTDLRPGDLVACAGAGYANHAEVVFVPRNLTAKIPLPPSEEAFAAGAFTTVGAIALQGVRQAAVTLGEVTAVIGLGLVGQLTVQLLKAAGCRVLGMDLNAARCALAEKLGCDATAQGGALFSALVRDWTGGAGVDAALITAATSSSAPLELAAETCRDRGRVVAVGLVGMEVPRKPFYDKELELRMSRSYGPGRYDPSYEEQGRDYPIGYVRWTENRNMQAFLDLVAQQRVQVLPLVTHRFAIDAANAAYDLITGEHASQALGVLLTYPEHASRTLPQTDETVAVNPATRPTRQTLRVGLIGAGLFAQGTLLPALKTAGPVTLQAVASAQGLSARHAAQKHGAAYCATDSAQLIADTDVDAVLIATRHGSHAALTTRALAAGKPVFVEKPLAVTEAQLAAVTTAYQAAEHAGRAPLVLVGFNRRFAPLAVQLKQFLAGAGPLTMHYRVNAGYIPATSWVHDESDGGGRIIGEVCHFVDFLQYLSGADPLTVSASAIRPPPGSDAIAEDNLSIQIAFADGSVGSILYAAGGDKSFAKERVEAFGGGRAAALDDFRSLELARGGKRTVQRARLQQDKGHAAELRAFVAAARGATPAPIPFQSLVLTTLATLRIRDALRSGGPLPVGWTPEPAAPPTVDVLETAAGIMEHTQ